MKYGKIAKMGSAKDKQDKYSTEFSKGESVVVNLPDGTNYTGAVVKDKGMIYVCNAWAYGRSSQIDRKLFLTVVLDYWQQVQKLKHGYFWFAPRQYQQFVMPYAQFLSSRDGIKESKMRTAIPMEHFSHAAFDLGGAHTLEAYKNWFARLVHIAELLQSPDVDFYCSN